jgi:uncharacterized protein (TIGR02996 family)
VDEAKALLRAVLAAPEDLTARLVYADWLDEHADPFASYVRTECEADVSPPASVEWSTAVGRLSALAAAVEVPLGGWRYEPVIARLRTKIGRVRQALASWGREPPAPATGAETDLLAFETRHGILLLAEYRAFLLRIGNERLGTGSGLLPLPLDGEVPSLRTPFPNSPAVIQRLAFEWTYAEAHEGQLPPADLDPVEVRHSTEGCLRLVQWGNSNESYWLGVNGPARGQVWVDGDWYNPLTNSRGDIHNFLSWYEEWLTYDNPEVLAE